MPTTAGDAQAAACVHDSAAVLAAPRQITDDAITDLAHISFQGAATPRIRARLPRSITGPAAAHAGHARPSGRRATVVLGGPTVDFVRWFLRHHGYAQSSYRLSVLTRRVPACLRALHVGTPAAARDMIERTPALASIAADSLFIGVTEFRRDPAVFDTLADVILPNLLGRRKKPLAVWSVGASSGAELYTLACLLGEAGALDGAQLVGTDIRTSALSQAAAGMMTSACAAAVPEAWRRRYFSENHGVLTARDMLRRPTRWLQHDALREPPPAPGRFDIILCRNVAIYLEPAAAGGLWQSLGAALTPGGCLVVGRAEKPTAPGLLRRAASIYLQPETRV